LNESQQDLYVATLLIEFLTGLWRFSLLLMLLFAVFAIFLALVKYSTYFGPDFQRRMGIYSFEGYYSSVLNGAKQWSLILAFLISYANIFSSLQSWIAEGGYLTRFVMGARSMSTREKEKIYAILKEIAWRSQREVKGFSEIYILDSPFDQVNLIGTTLYISSGAVQSEHIRVLLAHEIGHLDNGDGRTVLALRRLIFFPFQLFLAGVRSYSTNRPNPKPELKEFEAMEVFYYLMNKLIFVFCALLGGGLGVWIMSWHWARYFREVDYRADAYVASLGYKNQLIEYLEQGKFYDTSVPYMVGWRPANELRIDRLMHPHQQELGSNTMSASTG
jgi:Zn-dependent protease with chaperone function